MKRKRLSIKERIKGISIKARHGLNLLSIFLGLLGILALLSSIRVSKVEEDKEKYSHLTSLAAVSVKSDRYTNKRVFNDDLYPRVRLDTLEKDYENYVNWIECHRDYIDSLLDQKNPIDLSIIGKPELRSSLLGELEDISNNYFKTLNSYNERAEKLKELEDDLTTVNNEKKAAEKFSAIFILLSFVLQLLLEFCNYFNAIENCENLRVQRNVEKNHK